jgi:hypothetical protein
LFPPQSESVGNATNSAARPPRAQEPRLEGLRRPRALAAFTNSNVTPTHSAEPDINTVIDPAFGDADDSHEDLSCC